MFAGAIAPVAFLTPSRAVGIGCVALCAATLLWRRHPSAAMAVFAASMALAGHASAGLARRPQDGRLIDAPQAARSLLVGVPVLADAEVLDEPRRRGDDTMVRVALHRLRRGRVQRDVQDTVRLLSRGGLPPLSPGDRLRAWVTLRIVEPFANLPAVPGSRPFLAARLKSTRLIEQIRPAPAGPVRWLARLRRAARGRLDAGLAAGGATRRTRALAAALTYGDRERLEAVDRDRLMTAGATHILAISGLHVAILVGGLTLALGAARIGPRTRVLVVGAALATYLLLIPVRPSVVRAGLMGATLPGARWGGRALDTLNLLGAIGLACLVVDPALAGDAGFILSFTVTASLVHHTPARSAGGKKGWIHRLLAASFFAAAVSAPLTATFFGRIALAAPLANPFIVPLATGIVALSGVASGVSAIHPVLAMPLALPLQLLADALFHVADLAGKLGLPLLLVPRRRGLLVMGTVATMFLARRMDRSWRWPAIAAATAGLLAVAGGLFPPRPLPPGHLSLRALDVGQGDALLVGLPDGQALLIDGGGVSGSSFDVGSRVVVPALVDAGITHLAGVVLTHPHHDHGDGLHSVFEQLNVDEFWVTHLDSSSLQRALIDDAATHHVAIRTMRQGAIVERGTARLTCLHPSAHPTRKSNDGSMVLLVEVTDDGSILLPGDLEADGEARLRASGALRPVTVLKVAHHGSHTSTTASFLAAVRPAAAIISVGAGNPWGHPDDPVLDRLRALGVTVGRTDRDGAVTVTLVHGVPQLERMRRP